MKTKILQMDFDSAFDRVREGHKVYVLSRTPSGLVNVKAFNRFTIDEIVKTQEKHIYFELEEN